VGWFKKKSAAPAFTIGDSAIQISVSLRGGGPPMLLEGLIKAVKAWREQKVLIDLAAVKEIDSLGVSLLSELLVRGHLAGKDIDYINSSSTVERSISAYFYPAPEIRLGRETPKKIEKIGGGFIEFIDTLGDFLYLVSETLYWSIVALWRGDGHRKGAITAQALQIGVGALPIVGTISFLIGIVLVLQSSGILRQFGAAIFIADGLVVAMFAEMGPLMTAILLAGRSGAAIAAEISTMNVTEEIDALRTMALNPIRYIVVPKVWGILLTVPLLAIIASVIGVFGGFLIAVSTMDLAPQAFLNQAAKALAFKDMLSGFVKSLVFAFLIVILAAFFGLRVKGGPEGVGRATTAAVVAAIFAVIVADAAIGLMFYL